MRTCLPLALLLGCTPSDEPTAPVDFSFRAGVEQVTVTGAEPRQEVTLLDAAGTRLVTMIADDLGQAHFAYVPDEHAVIDAQDAALFPILDGTVVQAGDGYILRTDDNGQQTEPFRVLALDDLPPDALYDQPLDGVYMSLAGGLAQDGPPEEGFQYIRTRDGTLLSVMVRFPDPLVYGAGPFPTVIEYSGYSPSRPSWPDPGSEIANALGYASVGVNMRGTGCSGGVFDVFNRAQHADGYDVVEVVARQPWVLHNQVGMVGLSYPGISQLYVASTAPPSLAAVVPLSVIADAWEMQWPGGIYNSGFTRQWLDQRDADAQVEDGAGWVADLIEGGDTTCAENLALSAQNIDFEVFLHELEFRPRDADDRDLGVLVEQIEAPVFLAGGWQDEQTGALFGGMLDHFVRSPHSRFTLYNGRHPDGFSPDLVYRWFEFLELYLAERVPRMNAALRLMGGPAFGGVYESEDLDFEADRFSDYADDDYAGVLAAYEAEPPVRVLFEWGAADGWAPGTPTARFETGYEVWPSPEAVERSWFLGPDGLQAEAPAVEGADAWRFDTEAGADTFFGPAGYELMPRLWDLDWRPFAEGDVASYLTEPFAEDQVVAGPALADLYLRSPVEDASVQVTLTEVRPDGVEVLVQSGWLRLGHRAARPGEGLRLDRSYTQERFSPLLPGAWFQAQVEIPSFAHPIRAGSQLRMSVSAPGRNHGTWEFEAPDYATPPELAVGWGGARASALIVTTLPGIEIPAGLPECPSLRGQPCRAYEPVENTTAL